MNIYHQKQRWKFGLAAAAFLIVIASFWYTTRLVKRIQKNEKQKVELWARAVQRKASLVKFTKELFEKIKVGETKKAELFAEATRELSNGGLSPDQDPSFILKVLQENTTVPVILTDMNDHIATSRNLDSLKEKDTVYLKEQLAIMKGLYAPVEIDYYKGLKQRLYHKDSRVFNDIKLVFDSLVKSFMTEVVNSADVPVIFTNQAKNKIIDSGKIDSSEVNTEEKLKLKLEELSNENTPIAIDLGEESTNYIFYAPSELVTQLKFYPYVQFGVIGLFLIIAYVLFSTARKAEQDQVWVGMSKETAHQLGTPLSSLMAWNEHLLGIGVDKEIVQEMQQDVKRLNTITDRFSKIGSQPTLETENVNEVLANSVDYLKKRTSRNVNYHLNMPEEILYAKLSTPLFEWVIENICKNAVDSMDGKGDITVTLYDVPEGLYIDIRDTGKGIPKSKFKTVFEPGFTTKKRGWGLGLSLCKRIIEIYHNGKIYVLNSELNRGSTFRIELKRD
ncbi:MAG TPA: HAMP domain-containing sensor histidine kinase [Bacteroidia bacterium]|nr:HAMP domain-containing sensor histidine kinase [Bacteroidia bacterium]